MKLSNFKLIRTEKVCNVDFKFFGEVDVTTGILWFKKTETKNIYRAIADMWYFSDTGLICPFFQIYQLVRVWNAWNTKNQC